MKHERTLFVIALIVLAFILFHTCNNSDYTDYKPINDSTLIKANLSNAKLSNDITKLTKQTDSLKSIKQGLKIVYKEKVNNVYLTAPDTCKTYIDTIIKWHLEIDTINELTIKSQDSVIKDYSRMIVNYKDIVMVKDIQHYNDSLALRKQKRSKLKVGVGAFLGGLLIGIIK
jgi:major membrane immunogen (membrane-anchored lipoprotein)